MVDPILLRPSLCLSPRNQVVYGDFLPVVTGLVTGGVSEAAFWIHYTSACTPVVPLGLSAASSVFCLLGKSKDMTNIHARYLSPTGILFALPLGVIVANLLGRHIQPADREGQKTPPDGSLELQIIWMSGMNTNRTWYKE